MLYSARQVVAVLALSLTPLVAAPPAARAASIPQFLNGGGLATHSPGGPGGVVYQTDGISIPTGTAKPDSFMNKDAINFYNGGTTVATAGLGRTQSSNLAKIGLASGTGVSQVDPQHSQSESGLDLYFFAQWAIEAGTFGPPINTSFSIPIGVKVGGAGGSYAAFACDIHWQIVVNGNGVSDARAPYVVPATTFNKVGTYLMSFTAPPAPLAPTSIPGGSETYLTMSGTLNFRANNDDGPVLIEIPTAEEFGDQPDFALYDYEGGMAAGADVVPEPSAALAAVGAGGLLLGVRRRSQGNRM